MSDTQNTVHLDIFVDDIADCLLKMKSEPLNKPNYTTLLPTQRNWKVIIYSIMFSNGVQVFSVRKNMKVSLCHRAVEVPQV